MPAVSSHEVGGVRFNLATENIFLLNGGREKVVEIEYTLLEKFILNFYSIPSTPSSSSEACPELEEGGNKIKFRSLTGILQKKERFKEVVMSGFT
jgi:hypothetical protein